MKEQMKRSEKEKQAVKDRTNEVRKEIEAQNTERDKLRETVKELGEGADRVAQQVQEARTKRDHLRGLLNSLKERKAKLEHTMAESENDLSQVTLGLGGVHKASSTHPTRARTSLTTKPPRTALRGTVARARCRAFQREKARLCPGYRRGAIRHAQRVPRSRAQDWARGGNFPKPRGATHALASRHRNLRVLKKLPVDRMT